MDTSPPSETRLSAPAALAGKTVISVDAMGGDQGPAVVVAGLALSALKNPDIGFIVHGREGELAPLIDKRKLTDRCPKCLRTKMDDRDRCPRCGRPYDQTGDAGDTDA